MSIMIVPHPDDELLFGSSLLGKVSEVVTLTFYDEERRSLEQRALSERFRFVPVHLGLYDDWLLAPSEYELKIILHVFLTKKESIFVPSTPKPYGSMLHFRLEQWAEGNGFHLVKKKKFQNVKELFLEFYRSQAHIFEQKPEFFGGECDQIWVLGEA